jgi:hypothetical protein
MGAMRLFLRTVLLRIRGRNRERDRGIDRGRHRGRHRWRDRRWTEEEIDRKQSDFFYVWLSDTVTNGRYIFM